MPIQGPFKADSPFYPQTATPSFTRPQVRFQGKPGAVEPQSAQKPTDFMATVKATFHAFLAQIVRLFQSVKQTAVIQAVLKFFGAEASPARRDSNRHEPSVAAKSPLSLEADNRSAMALGEAYALLEKTGFVLRPHLPVPLPAHLLELRPTPIEDFTEGPLLKDDRLTINPTGSEEEPHRAPILPDAAIGKIPAPPRMPTFSTAPAAAAFSDPSTEADPLETLIPPPTTRSLHPRVKASFEEERDKRAWMRAAIAQLREHVPASPPREIGIGLPSLRPSPSKTDLYRTAIQRLIFKFNTKNTGFEGFEDGIETVLKPIPPESPIENSPIEALRKNLCEHQLASDPSLNGLSEVLGTLLTQNQRETRLPAGVAVRFNRINQSLEEAAQPEQQRTILSAAVDLLVDTIANHPDLVFNTLKASVANRFPHSRPSLTSPFVLTTTPKQFEMARRNLKDLGLEPGQCDALQGSLYNFQIDDEGEVAQTLAHLWKTSSSLASSHSVTDVEEKVLPLFTAIQDLADYANTTPLSSVTSAESRQILGQINQLGLRDVAPGSLYLSRVKMHQAVQLLTALMATDLDLLQQVPGFEARIDEDDVEELKAAPPPVGVIKSDIKNSGIRAASPYQNTGS